MNITDMSIMKTKTKRVCGKGESLWEKYVFMKI